MILADMAPREEYHSVIIRIFPFAGGALPPADQVADYAAEISVQGWRDFPGLSLRVDPTALRDLADAPPAYGLALGKMVFADDALGKAYAETIAATQGRGDGLHIRLLCQPPELQDIRWERVYQPLAGEWLPLGSAAATPFSRYVLAQQWDRPSPLTVRPLRLLAVISSPNNLAAFTLDPIAASERQALHTLLDSIPDVTVTYLESGTPNPPTLAAMRSTLAQGYHLVHVLSHGARTPGGTVLYLEKEDGTVAPVESSRIVAMTKVLENPPALVFLAACESAARGRQDAFVPLGPALVEDGGVQAVVAMTEKVGLQTAQHLAGQFYERLFDHGIVDLAMNEARALVQDEWDWGAPVLFSRLPDNQLVDFPVGSIYTEYLSHTAGASEAVDKALASARQGEHGTQLVDNLNQLIQEFNKSHKMLADVGDRFRQLGRDPVSFPQNFDAFYQWFKSYYDHEDWVDAKTSCHKIALLTIEVMPKLSRLLDKKTLAQLGAELDLLSQADNDAVRFFGEFLDAMNEVVDKIWAQSNAGNVQEAVRLKLEFEAQISPSLRRSKEALGNMSDRAGAVAAA